LANLISERLQIEPLRSEHAQMVLASLQDPLSDVDSCDAPVGTWNESESKLLLPVYDTPAEGIPL
jgi:hypothetical protein